MFIGSPLHFLFRCGTEVDEFQKPLPVDSLTLGVERLHDGPAQFGFQPGRISLNEEQISEMADQIAQQLGEVTAGLGLFVHEGERDGGVLGEQGGAQVAHLLPGREPKDGKHVGLLDLAPTKGYELVQHGFRVPHAAIGSQGDRQRGFLREVDPLLRGDVHQVARDDGGADALEVEPLAAGKNRGRELLDIGGGEEELHVRRRFLQRLEQGVERAAGEHVHLVHQIDFEAAAGRQVFDVVDDDFTDFVDLGVRGRIKFEHVEGVAGGDFAAGIALIAGGQRGAGAAQTVKRLGQNPGGRGLPRAPRADEQVRVGKAVLEDRVFQRPGDMFLAHDVVKRLRAVFPGEDRVAHKG